MKNPRKKVILTRFEEQRDQMLMFNLKHQAKTYIPGGKIQKLGRTDSCLRKVDDDAMEEYLQKGLYNSEWYNHTYATIRELFVTEGRSNLFILLLAATSPRCDLVRNVLLALKALKMYDDGASEELFYQEFMDTLVPNILRTFNGEPLSGPKVTAFAANLFGDLGRVTVDSWMLRAYTGNMKDGKLDDYTYECIERDVVRRTHEQSKKGPVPFKDPEGREGRKALHYPAEYQAAVWTGIKLLKGDPNDVADPFGILIRAHIQERQMKLAFDENDPDIPGSFAEFERLLGPLPKTTKREKAELELRENPPSNYVFYYDPRKVALK